jgi:ubiquitin carboxyl-terminal hydrolase 8
MLFLLEILDDELNPRRNIPPPPELTPAQEAQMNQLPVVQASRAAWASFTTNEDSIITQRMKGQITAITTCDQCNRDVRTFQTFSSLPLPISASTTPQSLERLICSTWGNNRSQISSYTCPHCNQKDITAQRTEYLSVLPDYLVVSILRYDPGGNKISTRVTFPELGLDITRACLEANTDEPGETDLRRIRPFRYDPYASIIHNGESTTSGHYFTFAKNPDKQGQAGQWNKFNDSIVENTSFTVLQQQVNTNILFKRQGSPTP